MSGYADILAAANAALGRDPADEAAAHAMAQALVMLGRAADLHRLAEHLNIAAGPGKGWVVLATALHGLLAERRYDALIALCESSPPDTPGYILTAYYGGCSSMMDGDMEAAIARFDWFRRHVRFYAGHIAFVSHPLLSMIYRQGRMVAAPDEIDHRLAAPVVLPALETLGELSAAADGEAAIFTCLDDQYFKLFGESFVAANLGLNPTMPLILHVIGPGDETRGELLDLTRRWPGRFAATVEAKPLFTTVTYYASARFFVVDQMTERFGRPMISLDGELQVPVERLNLAAACRAQDFACFGTGRDEPGSVWQASVMWFGQGAGTGRLTRALRAYCQPELNHPSLMTWQLDQAALLACRHYFEMRGPPLAFADLRDLLGLGLADVASDVPKAEAKESNKHGKMTGEVQILGPRLGDLYASL
ncbi:hypothetical protein CU669_16515 [Paramagnetospirillum kuznetsovii]|uniref:Uncharacterized protein n=1 Tax=Paramagnetospirillum kuznetsovii TaxID=2053833 RepID=A0A364NUY5_9PROT|nr:hypothetical protein [Paramagnetospirillum kuznetsovii]RAU20872.1 hypothetical protein CU669_16515 [Paramagnetospirillum kuznetsovii]